MKAKDLAKQLGVSPATVSLVLNDKPGVSDSLRAELIEKINAMGCGDMLSRSGKAGKNASRQGDGRHRQYIAYLSYQSCDQWEEERNDVFAFYPAVLEGAEMEARENGWNLVVYHVRCEGNTPLPELLRRGGEAVGVIVQGEATPQVLREVEAVDAPVVFIDSYEPDLDVSSVNVDNRQSMYAVLRHLADLGHREIGYVYGDGKCSWGADRLFAFHRGLNDLQLPDRLEHYFRVPTRRGRLVKTALIEALKQAEHMPTALAAESDEVAVQVIQALKKMGLRVPEDVSVVGFNNADICDMVEPPLTSVRNSRHLMGRECVAMIQNLRRLESAGMRPRRLKYRLPTELISRESVADLNGKNGEED